MANRLFTPGKESFGKAEINWPADTVRAVLLDLGTYTYNQSHQFLSSIPTVARIATSGNITGKTCIGGVFDSDNITFPGFSSTSIEALALYKFVTGDADSRLIFFVDTATGLPVQPAGEPIEIQWSASGIYRFTDAA